VGVREQGVDELVATAIFLHRDTLGARPSAHECKIELKLVKIEIIKIIDKKMNNF
jgi:hypothetical protein